MGRTKPYDITGDEMIELFQHLVDNGMAWTLQGHYGRTAHALIDAGLVSKGTHAGGFGRFFAAWVCSMRCLEFQKMTRSAC